MYHEPVVLIFSFCLQALKVLRTAEFAPFVVFIAAPNVSSFNDVCSFFPVLCIQSSETYSVNVVAYEIVYTRP